MYRKIQKVDKMSKKYKIRSLLKEKGTKGTKQGIHSYSIMYEETARGKWRQIKKKNSVTEYLFFSEDEHDFIVIIISRRV